MQIVFKVHVHVHVLHVCTVNRLYPVGAVVDGCEFPCIIVEYGENHGMGTEL